MNENFSDINFDIVKTDKYRNPWIIINAKNNDIISDAKGYGFKSYESALIALSHIIKNQNRLLKQQHDIDFAAASSEPLNKQCNTKQQNEYLKKLRLQARYFRVIPLKQRFVVENADTHIVVDDCNGYGYRTKENALRNVKRYIEKYNLQQQVVD